MTKGSRSAPQPSPSATVGGMSEESPFLKAASPVSSLQWACPPPIVTVVPSQPLGWELFSAILFGLLVRQWIAGLRRRSVPGPKLSKRPRLVQLPPDARQVRPGDASDRGAELASALRGLGYRKPEIQARLASADLRQPLEQLIRSSLQPKGGAS